MDAQNFHNLVVQEFGLQAYSPEEQVQYIDQISELVLQGVILKSFSAISDEQSDQLEQAVEQGASPEQLMSLLQSLIPGFSELVKDEVMQIKQDLATGMGTDTDSPASPEVSPLATGNTSAGATSIFG